MNKIAVQNNPASLNLARLSGPIGIFDSGPGGLAVLQQVMHQMPNEDVIYVGDTARQPYGPQPINDVRRYAEEISNFLFVNGAKMILISCNTATVAGLESSQKSIPSIPILGMLEPGTKSAFIVSSNNKIGVWGTEMTIKEQAYERACKKLNPKIDIYGVACPQLLRLAEKGDISDRSRIRHLSYQYFQPLRDAGVDTLILGCTDLTCIRDVIDEIVGEDITIIDPAEEVVKDAFLLLSSSQSLKDEKENKTVYKFLVTGSNVTEFAEFTHKFLGISLVDLQPIDVNDIQKSLKIF